MPVQPQEFVFEDDSPKEIFPIYFSRLAKVGLLGELSARTTSFYSRSVNLRHNVQRMQGRLRNGVPAPELMHRIEMALSHYTEDVAEAQSLIRELRAVPE